MRWKAVREPKAWATRPNRVDDEGARASFTWEVACAELDWQPDGGCNIAQEAVTRHAR